MSRNNPDQQLVTDFGRMADFLQRFTSAVYMAGGVDRDLDRIMYDHALCRRLAAIIVRKPDLAPWTDPISDFDGSKEVGNMAGAAFYAHRIMSSLYEQVVRFGGNDGCMQEVLSDHTLIEQLARCLTDRSRTCRVVIDPLQDFQQLIQAGAYHHVSEDFDTANLACLTGHPRETSTGEVTILLLHPPRSYTSPSEMIAEMSRRGHRPMTFPEMLALAAQHPGIMSHTIIALGSSLDGRHEGRRYPQVAPLSPRSAKRILWLTELRPDERQNMGGCYFGAVPIS